MAELRAENIQVQAGQATPVKNVSFELTPGTLTAVLGPNGAGKTLSLRASLGLTALSKGQSTINECAVDAMDPIERALTVSYLPQTRPLAWPNRVRDVVALGRFAHGGAMGRLGGHDAEAVDRALAACDLTHLMDRAADTLSGGELARMHCARAFAAETPLLIADEPVAALDPKHQFQVMDLFKTFVAEGGGALVVLHDIELAARYADRLLWISGGHVVADGPVGETLTSDRLAEVYGVRADVDGERVNIEGPLDRV